MKNKRKTPIPLVVAFVLFSAVLISSHFTFGLLARYFVSGEGDSETVVAAFGIEASADEVSPVTVTSDGTDDSGKAVYTVTVRNTGEVAVRYEAVVEFTGDDAQENEDKFDDSDDNLTFTGELEPGEETQEEITLDMNAYFDTVENKWSTLSNDDISGETGEAPFRVIVTFTQID